mgnify:FL=1
MRYYESLYIVNPNYEQSRLDEIIKTVSDKITEYGFKTINHFVWGKKRLAYSIQQHKYGTYVLLHFETEGSMNLDQFERFMVLQKTILRNQTVLLDDKPKKQSEKSTTSDEAINKEKSEQIVVSEQSSTKKVEETNKAVETDETPKDDQTDETPEAEQLDEPVESDAEEKEEK